MTRITKSILICLAIFAVFIPSSEGLAFVASFMRTPLVGPAAALTSLGRRSRSSSSSSIESPVALSAGESREDVIVAESPSEAKSYQFGNEADSTVQAFRNEMVDIVYQRSLARLNSFDDSQ